MFRCTTFCFFLIYSFYQAKSQVPPAIDTTMYRIAASPSAQNIQRSVEKLVSFGTRNTLSDTISSTRGIGAARRWIKSEFDRISVQCDDCLDVSYQSVLVAKGANRRIVKDVHIVNVLA